MTLEEYMEELYLMDKQYGQEEELYPLINILLRQSGSVAGLSLRDVHNASVTSDKSRKILYGLSSFPDMVVLDKIFDRTEEDYSKLRESIYGCIEVKIKKDDANNSFLNDLEPCEEPFNLTINLDETKKLEYGIKADLGRGYRYTYNDTDENVQLTSSNDGSYNIENNKMLTLSKDEFSVKINLKDIKMVALSKDGSYYSEDIKLSFEESGGENKKEKINEDYYVKFRVKRCDNIIMRAGEKEYTFSMSELSQLLGEILFYKKVIYTDGLSWHFFGLEDEGKFDGFDSNINNVVSNDNLNDVWYSQLIPKNPICKIKHKKIADLSQIFNSYKKYKKEIREIINCDKYVDCHVYKFTPAAYKKWNELLKNLAKIEWEPQTEQTKE